MQDYDKIINSLFERHQSVQNAGFTSDSYKPGLDRIRDLDRRMGCPSEHLRFIHVAGTNGKGSVCSMLAASLSGSGYRVGLFTSPHLLDFRERIKIVEDGGFSLIPRESVLEFLEKYDSPDLSFFEITTGMALWYFDRRKVDVVVLEVGLGGLLDSTNIVVPEISVVTSIGLDHCALLGDTRALIAGQKAGIFKSGVPAVVGERDPETAPVFEAAAASVHCPLFFADDKAAGKDLRSPSVILSEAKDLSTLTSQMDLKGEWQRRNLRTVLCALDLLGEDPDFEAITHAAAITGLRGRWETVDLSHLCVPCAESALSAHRPHENATPVSETDPFCTPMVIADIGHNSAALKENFARLNEMMASGAYDKLIIVYGVMADKDLDSIIPLMPRGAEYFFAAPDTPRALPADVILSKAKDLLPDAQACESVPDAVQKASAAATPQSLIYVGGSAFVVADFLKLLQD